jgi:hypothetical protein
MEAGGFSGTGNHGQIAKAVAARSTAGATRP